MTDYLLDHPAAALSLLWLSLLCGLVGLFALGWVAVELQRRRRILKEDLERRQRPRAVIPPRHPAPTPPRSVPNPSGRGRRP